MSPTLYTAKNNGGNDNGDSTTMVITTTMANNRIGFRDIRSTFPCFHVEILEPYKFTDDCGRMYRYCMDRMCPELWCGDIPSMKKVVDLTGN